MQKIFTIILLVACVGLSKCQDPDDNAVDAAPAKPPCSCILPVILLPGGGLAPGGLLPGGLSINVLNELLRGGILNKSNIDLAILKLILANPALLNVPGVISILTNALPGAAAAGAPGVNGLLNNLFQGGLLNASPVPAAPSGPVSGALNNVGQGGIGNGLPEALFAALFSRPATTFSGDNGLVNPMNNNNAYLLS